MAEENGGNGSSAPPGGSGNGSNGRKGVREQVAVLKETVQAKAKSSSKI